VPAGASRGYRWRTMVPLAFTSTALGVVGGTIAFALVFLAWLLHEESNIEAEERAEEQALRRGETQAK
jgi:hypothetical protein